jgi:osmotically-inducible protein OsmY
MPTAAAIVLSLSMVAGAFAPSGVEAVALRTTVPRAPRVLGGEPSGGQRAVDRVIERRVRGAIRADPFLAASRVKVTSRRGIVRLVGRVRTAKERSSIAFKAGQSVRGGYVDDRVTIGYGVEAATR